MNAKTFITRFAFAAAVVLSIKAYNYMFVSHVSVDTLKQESHVTDVKNRELFSSVDKSWTQAEVSEKEQIRRAFESASGATLSDEKAAQMVVYFNLGYDDYARGEDKLSGVITEYHKAIAKKIAEVGPNTELGKQLIALEPKIDAGFLAVAELGKQKAMREFKK